jgi:hypothetical protein
MSLWMTTRAADPHGSAKQPLPEGHGAGRRLIAFKAARGNLLLRVSRMAALVCSFGSRW